MDKTTWFVIIFMIVGVFCVAYLAGSERIQTATRYDEQKIVCLEDKKWGINEKITHKCYKLMELK